MKKMKYEGQKAVSYLLSQPGMTIPVARTLERKLKRLKSIPRDKPPVKGAFINYQAKNGSDKLLSWTMHVKRLVIKEIEKLCSSSIGYQSLLEMENFQFNQKGPMAPIEENTVINSVIPKLVQESEKTPDELAKRELLKHTLTVREKYSKFANFGSKNLTDVNFEIAWAELPSASLRGIPFLRPGGEVDEMIIKLYGSSLKPVLNQFMKIDSLITTPGLRIQGSPKWDQAKVRLINIPSVNYQYLINGLYKTIKTELIKVPSMSGWLTPDLRDQAIVKMCQLGKKLDMIPIPIDFRSFDARMFPALRVSATNLLLDIFKSTKDLDVIKEKITTLYNNQLLCGPATNSNITFFPVDNLLGSGVANTQADGSTLNAMLQAYLCSSLGFVQPHKLGLTLGDDAVIWVPKSIVDKLGYEGILKFWQKRLDPLNMEIHVKKKYPLPQVMFLQRLYEPDKGIIGEYSLVRNVDSIVWAERFRKPIEGVHNHMALETIGQISTLNNSMEGRGDVSLKSVAFIVVREWLKVDKALCYLANLSAKTSNPTGSLFGYLVKASGGIEAIIRAYKLEQYDHKGLLEKFALNSADSFPIISVIIDEALKLPSHPISLLKVYGLKDSAIGSHEMASETVIEEMMDEQ